MLPTKNPLEAVQILVNTAHEAPMNQRGHQAVDTLGHFLMEALTPKSDPVAPLAVCRREGDGRLPAAEPEQI